MWLTMMDVSRGVSSCAKEMKGMGGFCLLGLGIGRFPWSSISIECFSFFSCYALILFSLVFCSILQSAALNLAAALCLHLQE